MVITQERRERYRRALLSKGLDISTLLADVLAGKDRASALAAIPALNSKPGMRKEEKLRAYLDFIESRRRSLLADDGEFGNCTACGDELSEVELDEVPWAYHCRGCSATS